MRIVIIGAGECGIRAALTLREQGFDGVINLIHAEAHVPYERPPLSKPSAEGVVLKPISGFDEVITKKIVVHQGLTVTSINRGAKEVELSNNQRLPYDKLLIATGARPRSLVVSGKEITDAVYLRTYNDASSLFDMISPDNRLSIIGGGFIGLEIASEARKRGAPVNIIEVAPRILGRAVPAALAEKIQARHRKEGVKFHVGQAIMSINESRTILLSDGSEVKSDVILAGIGSLPNVELAAAAGLSIENGIAVNCHLQTSDPYIYAAGDCCSFPHPLYGNKRVRIESWRAAQEQGDHVAKSILGSVDPYHAVPWFWSDQYDLTLQIVGLAMGAIEDVERKLDDTSTILFHIAADGRLLAASGLGVGNRIARDIRIAELLIAKEERPDISSLSDPNINLKGLL